VPEIFLKPEENDPQTAQTAQMHFKIQPASILMKRQINQIYLLPILEKTNNMKSPSSL